MFKTGIDSLAVKGVILNYQIQLRSSSSSAKDPSRGFPVDINNGIAIAQIALCQSNMMSAAEAT